eukprot:gene7766-1392_t
MEMVLLAVLVTATILAAFLAAFSASRVTQFLKDLLTNQTVTLPLSVILTTGVVGLGCYARNSPRPLESLPSTSVTKLVSAERVPQFQLRGLHTVCHRVSCYDYLGVEDVHRVYSVTQLSDWLSFHRSLVVEVNQVQAASIDALFLGAVAPDSKAASWVQIGARFQNCTDMYKMNNTSQ